MSLTVCWCCLPSDNAGYRGIATQYVNVKSGPWLSKLDRLILELDISYLSPLSSILSPCTDSQYLSTIHVSLFYLCSVILVNISPGRVTTPTNDSAKYTVQVMARV